MEETDLHNLLYSPNVTFGNCMSKFDEPTKILHEDLTIAQNTIACEVRFFLVDLGSIVEIFERDGRVSRCLGLDDIY